MPLICTRRVLSNYGYQANSELESTFYSHWLSECAASCSLQGMHGGCQHRGAAAAAAAASPTFVDTWLADFRP